MAHPKHPSALRHSLYLLLAAMLGWVSASSAVLADWPGPKDHSTSVKKWQIVETANLRILSFDVRPVSGQLAASCEAMRTSLQRRWLGGAACAAWTPKCDVVLHPSDASYMQEVGAGAGNTAGSSLVQKQHGKIILRRIDVRATRSDWQTTALGHEITHLILAERFSDQTLPRWVDEGTAVLADPLDKRLRHKFDLDRALSARNEFRVAELISMNQYPCSSRWATFYGQSASLVEFLVNLGGEPRFLEFVETSFEHGYDVALRQTYGFGTADLERRWRDASISSRDWVARN